MNVDVSDMERELAQIIKDWMKAKNLLNEDEMIEVRMRVKKLPKLIFNIEPPCADKIFDSLQIKEIDFSRRIQFVLERQNIVTVSDLRKITLDRMLKFRHLGKKSVSEIYHKITDLGFVLDWDQTKLGPRPEN